MMSSPSFGREWEVGKQRTNSTQQTGKKFSFNCPPDGQDFKTLRLACVNRHVLK